MSSKLRIGDVFEVPIEASSKRYFQYVANDSAQLQSNVVRVFRETYPFNDPIEVKRATSGAVDFYAHVLIPIGVKLRYWKNVGNAVPPAKLDVLFRSSNDYGNPKIEKSKDWYIWKVNGSVQAVGELRAEHQSAELGAVVPPDSLVYRMLNGEYDFKYPGY